MVNLTLEMAMSSKFLNRLEREHARLGAAIVRETRCKYPDEVEIARLKKRKLAIKDKIMLARNMVQVSVAA